MKIKTKQTKKEIGTHLLIDALLYLFPKALQVCYRVSTQSSCNAKWGQNWKITKEKKSNFWALLTSPNEAVAGRANREQRAPSTAVETVCAHKAFIGASRGLFVARTKEPQSLGHGARTGGNTKATWMTVRDFVRSRFLLPSLWGIP